jgi:hypothetical protein
LWVLRRVSAFFVEGHYQVLGLGEVDPELVAEMVKTFNDVLMPSQ